MMADPLVHAHKRNFKLCDLFELHTVFDCSVREVMSIQGESSTDRIICFDVSITPSSPLLIESSVLQRTRYYLDRSLFIGQI